MRTLIVFLFFCFYLPTSAQNYAPEQTENIKIAYLPINELEEQINSSKSAIKIIYFYSTTCSATLEFNPIINDYYLKNKDKFELFVISRESKRNQETLYNDLFYEGFYFPVYLTNKKSFSTIIKTLCSDCNEDVMSDSSFYILDADNTLLAQSHYDLTADEKKNLLIKYIE
ncbi:hypothetical protein [Bizionia algoritergicola]|uniref:Redoxin domain-containing protein n=1 Tax=Bizionia algoritergicola TaxID=291187 RepID=A0A5D0R0N6_9FLAO|nr:hypothetical protein [Bizionia algoritergicola]TYB75103.1 hypothetical protein ES675_02930 [Bizionia algoritergicola]